MKVGFIGLGMMGGGMSLNLRHAEHDMTVFDLNKDAAQRQLAAGCDWADSPKQVAEASKAMPKATAEEAGRTAETLAKEVASEVPRRKWYELSIEGLRDAAKADRFFRVWI